MSDADKLFKKLGYNEMNFEDGGATLIYEKPNGVKLIIDKWEKGCIKELDCGKHALKIRMLISFNELKAINKKVEELRLE